MGWFDRKKVVKANKTAEPQLQHQSQLQPQTQHHQVPALPAPPSYHNAVTNQPSQQWAPPFGFQPGFGPAPVVVNQVQNFYGLADNNNNSEARPPTAQTQLVARPKHRHGQPLDKPQSKPAPKSSCAALTVPDMAEIEAGFHPHAQELIHQTSLAVDLLTNTFAAVLATIDEPTAPEKESSHSKPGARKTRPSKSSTKPPEKSPCSSPLAKIYAYANSRLPSDLKPLRLYIPTWPLLCLAAHYAERVYSSRPDSPHITVAPDLRTGAKAMLLATATADDAAALVLAVRGSASLADWAVNLRAAPASPAGFLDDAGNLCHAGFLSVARAMAGPLAARLRRLLDDEPRRRAHSLLVTGHSAGGAVAALLFGHMLAVDGGRGPLADVARCFRRVHCVVFGCPPVSLLPLALPPGTRRNLFLGFVNEGDPVVRADRGYVKSLVELMASPVPVVGRRERSEEKRGEDRRDDKRDREARRERQDKREREDRRERDDRRAREKKSMAQLIGLGPKAASRDEKPKRRRRRPVWPVPTSTLSVPGRIVVLRGGRPEAEGTRRSVEARLDEGVVAHITTDEQLRSVVWGDPVAHSMRLYAGRVETLAVGAVLGRRGGPGED
ncbi:hypothetical protein HYQ45_015655 [Verticillium longisporum]|uniref:Fungal lipase-type domain-containing protein n=1 Tax=Verticillium longisporum TaxID=100787 RepID=A0A8I3AKM3_VERLO|nr:hypothetical protein HYQ45_015655 [Verticillium longisporum]